MNLSLSINYNGFSVNTVTPVAGGGAMSGYAVESVEPSNVGVRAFTSPRAQHDGRDASNIYLDSRQFSAIITVYGSTKGDFWDKTQALLAAFSPTLAYTADSAAFGYLSWNFYQSTANIVSWPLSAYPLGIPLAYKVRPVHPPIYVTRRDEDGGADAKGLSKQFRVTLEARDPRKITQAENTAFITTSTTTTTNKGDYPAETTIVIFSSSSTGTLALTIGSNTFSVTVDATSQTYTLYSVDGTLYKGSNLAMSLLSTGAVIPQLDPGDTTLLRSGVAISSANVRYRDSFA